MFILMLALPTTAQAAWNQAQSKHFIVYSDGSAKQLQDYAEDLERFDNLLRLSTGAKGEDNSAPVRVFMVRSDGQVQSIADRKYIGGFYSVGRRNGYAIVSRAAANGRFDADGQKILFHEYTHHFMLHYFPAAYPAWYVEGFAEFYATATFKEGGELTLGQVPVNRIPTLVRLPLYPLADLFRQQTYELDRVEMSRFYGTAWLLTHFLRSNATRGGEFDKYLTDLGTGKAIADPGSYFAGGLPALEKDLRAYKSKPISYRKMSMTTPPEVKVQVSPLPAAESALILDEIMLLGGVGRDETPKMLAEVQKATTPWAQTAYANALLADAEIIAGNDDAAAAAADRAIAIDPKNARALSTRAAVQLYRAKASGKDEDWKAALGFIVRANRADTEDPVPLEQYYRYFRMRGKQPPDVAYDGLRKALSLLPQSPQLRFQVASALGDRKDYDSAAAILTPIAFSPHASQMQARALELRTQFLAAKDTKAPVRVDVEGED